MDGETSSSGAQTALKWVLAAGFLLMLGLNLPGHLSYDSVAQLHEGHFGVRETWGPALYAWVLGAFDRLLPGAALYVTASSLLFFVAVASLAALRPRVSWLAPLAAALIVLTPQVLIYQAIVWKDVLCANASVAALVLLSHVANRWPQPGRRWLLLAAALVLLALASQVRQNGLIAAVFAAIALGWTAARGRLLRGLAWGFGAFLVVALLGSAFTRLATPPNAPADLGIRGGLHILQKYDLVGAAALDPQYRFDALAADAPLAVKLLHERARLTYSGRRVDFIDADPVLAPVLGVLPGDLVEAQWADLALRHPALYLRIRWGDFRWLVAPPVIDWCLPVYVGVDQGASGPDLLSALKMPRRYTGADRELNNYATWFYGTPALIHLTYAALSLVLGGLFLWRRDPADIPMAALQLAGLAFCASFFVISIACDYRYLYFTDLAALTGLIYAAVDPRFSRSATPIRRPGSAAARARR